MPEPDASRPVASSTLGAATPSHGSTTSTANWTPATTGAQTPSTSASSGATDRNGFKHPLRIDELHALLSAQEHSTIAGRHMQNNVRLGYRWSHELAASMRKDGSDENKLSAQKAASPISPLPPLPTEDQINKTHAQKAMKSEWKFWKWVK